MLCDYCAALLSGHWKGGTREARVSAKESQS